MLIEQWQKYIAIEWNLGGLKFLGPPRGVWVEASDANKDVGPDLIKLGRKKW